MFVNIWHQVKVGYLCERRPARLAQRPWRRPFDPGTATGPVLLHARPEPNYRAERDPMRLWKSARAKGIRRTRPVVGSLLANGAQSALHSWIGMAPTLGVPM